ncbi:MAG: type II secretion system protein [Phycisphaerales bacterium]|nr:type II secretion system protein [Planctomycetota bacterium]
MQPVLFTSRKASARRAFTLIEVLLGVMIMALGLLGLGAIFPLVVKQQRTAQDVVVGLSSAKSAESMLRSHTGLFDPSLNGGWAALARRYYATAKVASDGRMSWDDVLGSQNTYAVYGETVDQSAKLPGTFRISSDRGANYDVTIKSTDRLLPAGVGGVDPQFVWDAVPILANPVDKNITITDPSTLPIRLTVFIRRLDPGIRVPAGKTLLQAIADGNAVPVATDSAGQPSLNGIGGYSTFYYPQVSATYRRFGASGGPYNVLVFNLADNAPGLAAVRQVGQQLVDSDGNIYTVIALPDETGTGIPYASNRNKAVVISPGLPDELVTKGGTVQRPIEMLCTPQVPAAVNNLLIRL